MIGIRVKLGSGYDLGSDKGINLSKGLGLKYNLGWNKFFVLGYNKHKGIFLSHILDKHVNFGFKLGLAYN